MTPRTGSLRRILTGGVAVALLVTAVLGSGLIGEVFPTQATKAPALVMSVPLSSRDSQTGSFLVDGGRYKVEFRLDLKHGPRGYQTEHYDLKGLLQIEDQFRIVRLSRSIDKVLLGHEIGGELFEFDAREVGGEGPKALSLRLSLEPKFLEHYSNMTLLIRRQPRWPIVD